MKGISANPQSWFRNKVLNKAVKQIKNTLHYLDKHETIIIENEKGVKMNVREVNHIKNKKKIIIYSPEKEFPDELRFQKFYYSLEVESIHLFHIEDYFYVCKYLKTPAEVHDYLDFRENFYVYFKDGTNKLPEQYLLGHFFETPNADHYNSEYIKNLKSPLLSNEEFDISGLVENFKKSIIHSNSKHETSYYPIVKAIAKLRRSELLEFKKRITLAIEKCETSEFVTPYKMYSKSTSCAFVFIPLHSNQIANISTALRNLTYAIKYDHKARKALGVAAYRHPQDLGKIETSWYFLDEEFEINLEMEKLLKENYPFRPSIEMEVKNPYK